jgi:hypothetical protein
VNCRRCGTDNEVGSNFCLSCGASFAGWWLASDGEWYPPELANPPTTPPASTVGGPPVPPTVAPGAVMPEGTSGSTAGKPSNGRGTVPSARSRFSWKVVVFIVVAAALIGAVVGVVVVRVTSTDVAALTLEPADSAGANPFTDSVASGGPVAFPPNVQTATAATRASFTKDANTGALVAPASAPGLYGGSGDTHVCNPQQIVDYLAHDPAKAKAWASVFEISTDDIASYVASLTPVLLTSDTLVTNHGYHNGKATSLQSVLQSGTAVLVDSTGTPRVKCNCGNPLTPPDAISLSSAKLTGTAWPGYNVTNFTIVQATTQITTFVIINVQTGATYSQPAPVAPASPSGGGGGSSGGMWVAAQAIPTAGAQIEDSTAIRTSPDGTTWTKVGEIDGEVLDVLGYGNGVWIGAASNPGGTQSTIYKSGDLAHWSAVANEPGDLSSVAYGAGRWVIVGYDTPGIAVNGTVHTTRVAYTSTDAMTWTDISIDNGSNSADQELSSVAFGDGSWTAVGTEPGLEQLTTFRSADGTTWTAQGPSLDIVGTVAGVAFHGGQWTLVANPGLRASAIYQSTDGYSWASVQGTTGFPVLVDSVAAGDPGYLAVGNDYTQGSAGGASAFYTSPDGKTWSQAGQIDTSVTALAFGATGTDPAASSPTTSSTFPREVPPCTNEAVQAALQNTADATNVSVHCNGTWAAVAGIAYKDGTEGNALFRANGLTWESGGDCSDPVIPPDIYQVACTSS